jgi:hypothetical protein
VDKIKLLEMLLEIDSIIVGERVKGGVFRPCQETIPSSTIEGALKHYFGLKIPAVGFFEDGTYMMNEFTYSVRDKLLDISKMPIIANYLAAKTKEGKIKAKVYVPSDREKNLQDVLLDTEFQMGALKSKGFGKCKVVGMESKECEIKQGSLNVKLFEVEIEEFGIGVISPVYGYLFKPDELSIGGVYRRALFPGSLVNAPEVLLTEVTYYDK